MENFELSVKLFDEYAREYAERFKNIESYTDSIDSFCSLINCDQPKILELGCGPGNVTQLLKLRFPQSKITALDLAPKMIEIARNQLPEVDFRVMDVRNISTLTEKFDAVMCSFCLPFLSKDDAAKLITDCSKNLKSGGILYISTMEGDETRAGFESTSFSGTAEVYFNYHRYSDLETAFLKSGFEMAQMKSQDYQELDGSITTDLIFIGLKN